MEMEKLYTVSKDGEALYSQQKQNWELTAAQIMKYSLPNSDLLGKTTRPFRYEIKSLMIIQWK